ncbi:MAG: ParB/RepB/Spo0J family partition protein [Planctomycetota bacterium]|jgi:ParB/RepB/Spo0J family partition protein
MTNQIQSIAIEKLVAHPDNPNRMSSRNYAKLVRNIERTGRYEPLVVRPCPERAGFFQIINGHHRRQALQELGYKTADAIVWDIDNRDADILLATINRLGGSDVLDKKLALLRRLNYRTPARELAKLLPQTAKQIERLCNLKCPTAPAKISIQAFASPLVFFVNARQQKIIQKGLSLAKTQNESAKSAKTKAAKNAAALTHIAKHFIEGAE